MKAARVSGAGQVLELFPADKAGLVGLLAPALIEQLVDVADAMQAGDWLDGPPPQPAPTLAEYTAVLQEHIEATARARGYDGAIAAASYVPSTVPAWAAEAAAFVAWRDQVWVAAYAALAAVQAGQRTAPTLDGLVAEMPAMVWPS